ncbi:MAG: cyclic nucleotide-binding domain-containing protein [Spirochaetales bacterium]
MPKATQYKTNSVIFFQGDAGDKIFILKAGKVLLKSNDIETKEEIKELVASGEFFGVKSALGRYPRDETAQVLSDAEVLVFTVPEFEQLVLSNTRIIMKMLKVFSNQLRRMVSKVQNLISKGNNKDLETGLFGIGEYYYNNRHYKQAQHALTRYLGHYPEGRYSAEASELARKAGQGAGKTDSTDIFAAAGAEADFTPPKATPAPGSVDALAAKGFFEAVALANQEKYLEAFKIFQKLVSTNADPEHAAKAEFEMGRCLVFLTKYDEAIKHLTALITKYPKHPDLKDALFFIGRSYQGKGDATWARNFFNKILGIAAEDEPVSIKTRKALKELEGAKA